MFTNKSQQKFLPLNFKRKNLKSKIKEEPNKRRKEKIGL